MIRRFSVVALLVAAGVIAGIVLSGTTDDRDELLALPGTTTIAEQPAPAPAAAVLGGAPDFTRVAAQTGAPS